MTVIRQDDLIQSVQDALQHIAWIPPWTAAAVLATLRLREQRLDEGPLFFGQVHAISLRGGRDPRCRRGCGYHLRYSSNVAQTIYEMSSKDEA